MGRRGFTLIEILVVVLLAGMVTTLALAPVVFTVRRVVETQADYSDKVNFLWIFPYLLLDMYVEVQLK